MTAAAIGARIREERGRLGFTQTAFAGLASMSRGAQLKWEKGQSLPAAAALAALAGAGADILYIVTGRRDPFIAAPAPAPAAPSATPPASIADALASIAAQVAPARVRLVIEPADEAGV